MSWLGKVVGGTFGFLMGGPVGAILGAAFGHQIDQNGLDLRLTVDDFGSEDSETIQLAFFTATFSLMGYIAKSDGRVSEQEIAFARNIMDKMVLPTPLRHKAMDLFAEGKQPLFDVEAVVADFHRHCRNRDILSRTLIEILTAAALVDGSMSPNKEGILLHICQLIGFSKFEFYGLRARLNTEKRFANFGSRDETGYQRRYQRANGPLGHEASIGEAYDILGVPFGASESEVKQAYRRLISQHHPDKLAAKGANDRQMKSANDKTQKIQRAYDAIIKSRKS
jgi:DnaJ like chaperone protein